LCRAAPKSRQGEREPRLNKAAAQVTPRWQAGDVGAEKAKEGAMLFAQAQPLRQAPAPALPQNQRSAAVQRLYTPQIPGQIVAPRCPQQPTHPHQFLLQSDTCPDALDPRGGRVIAVAADANPGALRGGDGCWMPARRIVRP
jgi:hypothetical protein